jgi:hypothetical protein
MFLPTATDHTDKEKKLEPHGRNPKKGLTGRGEFWYAEVARAEMIRSS